MKKTFFILVIILGVLASILGAVAYVPIDDNNREMVESRIYSYNNTYVINYSLDGQEYRVMNRSESIGKRSFSTMAAKLLEMDGSIGQKIEVNEDRSGISFTTFENPNHPYSSDRVPLRVCFSGVEVMNAKRFETDIPYCDEEHEYYFGNIKIGETYTARFKSGTLSNMTGLVWWLGEDDYDGTYGQGGIGTCEFVFADISHNQTSTLVGNSFIFGMKWDGVGDGCAVSTLYEESYTDEPIWRTIPTTNTSNTNLQCLSTSCIKSSPVLNQWYYRTVKCKWEGNRATRVRIVSRDEKYNSPTRWQNCYVPEVEVTNNSIRAENLFAPNISLTTNDYFPFVNYTLFANGTNKTFTLLTSYNIRKQTGSGTNEVWSNITIDGIEVLEEKLRTVSIAAPEKDEGVAGNKFINFTLDEGNHIIELYFKRTGTGEVIIDDADIVLLQFATNDNDDVTYDILKPNYDHDSTNFSEAYNFSYNSTNSPLAFFGKFAVSNNETALNSYSYKNLLTGDISSYFYRHLANGGDTGSIGTFGIDDNTSEIKNYTILSKVDGGRGVNNASLLIFDLEDNESHTIQHFYSGNLSTNDTANLTLTAGTYLIDTVTLNITVGSGILLSGSYSFKSSSGVQTPTFFMNSSNIALCSAKKERYLSGNTDFGNAFYYKNCQGIELNMNNTFNFWVTVPAGETLVLLDEAFTGIVTDSIDLTAGTVPSFGGVGAWWILALPFLMMITVFLVVKREKRE